MKIKTSNLEWYVLYWDFNEKKVVNYNILAGLAEDLAREVKSGRVYSKSILREFLKTEFMYNYWSKSEWEFFVSDLHAENCYEKVDVWRQIEPNLDRIVEYINTQCDLNFK